MSLDQNSKERKDDATNLVHGSLEVAYRVVMDRKLKRGKRHLVSSESVLEDMREGEERVRETRRRYELESPTRYSSRLRE